MISLVPDGATTTSPTRLSARLGARTDSQAGTKLDLKCPRTPHHRRVSDKEVVDSSLSKIRRMGVAPRRIRKEMRLVRFSLKSMAAWSR
jgi:hypothetical protein